MPRGLIILILFLLIGIYFIFFHGHGGVSSAKLPALALDASVSSSSKGYLISVNGNISLPNSEEYNISAVHVEIYVDDKKAKDISLEGGVMQGPGQYPIHATAVIPFSASSAKVQVSATVLHGDREDDLFSSIPVVLPSADMRVKAPQLFLGIASVTPVENNESVTFTVTLFNPNKSEMKISDAKLVVGSVSRALSLSNIPAGGNSTATATVVLPDKPEKVDVRLTGKYNVSGASSTFEYSGTVNIPSIPFAKPYAHVNAKILSASDTGIKFSLSGTVYNPNKVSITVERVYIKVLGPNGLIQEFNWVSDKTVDPSGSLALPEKTITVDEDMYKSSVEVIMKYDGSETVVAAFPLLAVDIAGMLSAPKINTALSYDANTGRCTVTLSITNPNSVTIDVNGLHIYFEQAGNDDDNAFSAFTVAPNATETRSFTPSLFVSPVVNSTIKISGRYGLAQLGAWIPFEFTIVGKCS